MFVIEGLFFRASATHEASISVFDERLKSVEAEKKLSAIQIENGAVFVTKNNLHGWLHCAPGIFVDASGVAVSGSIREWM